MKLFFISGISLVLLIFTLETFSTEVTVTEPIVVVPHSKIPCTDGTNSCGNPSPGRRFDSTVPSFIDQDGQRAWLVVNSKYVKKFKGPFNDPFQTPIWTKQAHVLLGEPAPPTDVNIIRDKKWIMNLFQGTAGELLGFVHVEREDGHPDSNGKGRIGLAWSNDYGESFDYLGNIAVPFLDPDGTNVAGVPYFIKDGWIYVYYYEKCFKKGTVDGPRYMGTAVIRANITSVINAARLGSNVVWKKYFEGGSPTVWSENGIEGKCTMVIDPVNGITHGDVVHSNVTNKAYMLTHHSLNGALVSSNGYDKSFVRLMSSLDGFNWSFERTLIEEGASTIDWGFAYPFGTPVQTNLRDNNSVSDRFYVYVARDAAAGPEYLDQGTLIRMEVDINGRHASMPRDFSGTQDLQNFDYYYGGSNGSGYMSWYSTTLPNGSLDQYWKGNENYLLIKKTTDKLIIHPGASGDAALRWNPPENGPVNISGQVQDLDTQCGDGAVFRILNTVNDVTTTLYSKVLNTSTTINFNLNTNVSKGKKLYFIVNPNSNSNNGCDSTGLKFDIQYTN